MMTKLLRVMEIVALSTVLSAASAQANVVAEWNALAVQCISLGAGGLAPSRPGPPGLLDLAIVHAAMHDAIQAIERKYEPYLATPAATGHESVPAAGAAAAHRVLSQRVCPDYVVSLDAAFKPYLDGGNPGLKVGFAAGDTLIAEYRVPSPAPVTPGTAPGEWRPTPPGNLPFGFLFLATTRPFTFDDPSEFRMQPPPPLGSRAYLRDYNEVKRFGAVESHPAVGACPAASRTDMARFWSGNFISQWNEAVRLIAVDQQLTIGKAARLMALANLAAADAAITVWDSKYTFNFWRPIAAIREGHLDGNDATVGDPAWTPFISSAHFPAGSQTPPYPDYTSGANGLTGAIVTTLQLFFRTNELNFEVYKATPAAVPVCTNPRLYQRLSDAAEEVVDARVLLGIHFRFADEVARRQGTRVARWVFERFLRPVHDDDHDRDDNEDYR
jgi:hypothetical protein